MAKDPAFLFYPGDWQGGTMYFDHQTKGAYIDLMILQFNVGRFTEAQAKQVLSICFSVAWPMLKQKFITDGEFYWNERLQLEIEKRQNFTKSRRENALGEKKNKAYAKASAKHMHEHMENENENINTDNIVIKKTKKDKPKIELVFPAPQIEHIWIAWSAYKKSQHGFVYKAPQTAQIAINNLWELSGHSPTLAQEIANYSMGNGYKGFFKPNNNFNGQQAITAGRGRSAGRNAGNEQLAAMLHESINGKNHGAGSPSDQFEIFSTPI